MMSTPNLGSDGPPGVDHREAATRLSDQAAVFIDVREPEEWDEGHIPGALHIPLGELSQRLGEVPGDTDLILVCRSGGRSSVATEFLLDNGYARAANLAGGMLAWEEAGHPIES